MNDVKIEISLLELKLPETGYVVILHKYLTTGQSRELQHILVGEGSYDTAAGAIKNISTKSFFIMQDKAAEFLIKEIKEKNGETKPFSLEWLSSLPAQDGNLVYNKINEITGAAALSPEAKKK